MSAVVTKFHHLPVMRSEVVDAFSTVPAGLLVDATAGGGGHSVALLESRADLSVLALDRDPVAVEAAQDRLRSFGERAQIVHTEFDTLAAAIESIGVAAISGALFDLGVSSPQLDEGDRGFAHRREAELDMRMDPSLDTPTAADLLNTLDTDEIAQLLRANADERHAWRIAQRIVASRPIKTTTQLAEIVREAVPRSDQRPGGHPAARTFQALRIAVNDELGQLQRGLDAALPLLTPGGRCAVLSYHSGEDRVVKATFASAAGLDQLVPQGFPIDPRMSSNFRVITKGAMKPSSEEVAANPRAKSARLRIVERVTS